MPSTAEPLPLVRKLQLSGGRRVSLDASIGRGTQGRVYSGQLSGEWGGQRNVAVKVFDFADGDATVLGILTEAAQRGARVHHPHVAQTYDFDLSARDPFVVTELIEGGTLETLMDGYTSVDQQLPQNLALLIAIKIAEGLSGALAAAQLVHGNLSPRDVLISWSGEVKVTDFGLSAAASAISMVRPVNTITRLAFVAPEVACGGPATARSDVFSLGIVLHLMVCGQRFSPHISSREALSLVREGVVHKSLSEPQLLQPLRAILRRCLEKDPALRYAHAGEVAEDLKKIAVLLGIPDVPAYIALAVEAVFGCEEEGFKDSNVAFESAPRDVHDAEIYEVLEAELIAPPARESGFLEREVSPRVIIRRLGR